MDLLDEIGARIFAGTRESGEPTWVDGMMLFAAEAPTEPLAAVTEPMLALIAQGEKRSSLGGYVFDHHRGQALAVTVDLPLVSKITSASPDVPFLAFGLKLEPTVIAQLLVEGDPPSLGAHTGAGIAILDVDEVLLDPIARLLRLMETPRDMRVLAPDIRREIHWRLLTGPCGALVRQIGSADSQLALVARAIGWLRRHYDEVIRIDDLAVEVSTSVSSLNRHFRAVTSMSPLQYQKLLRLQSARIQLMTAPRDVSEIGHSVGYSSASQFSREYRRMFGASPSEDAATLRDRAVLEGRIRSGS